MTAAPARLIVSFAVDAHHRLTAEIESHGDGRHAVTVTRWIAGRQLEPAVRVPAVTSSRIDALATAVMLALAGAG